MDKIFLDENYTNRILKANNALLKAYDSLNFADPNWDQKVERLSKLHKEIAQDINNANEAMIEAEKLRIEEEKNKVDAENKVTEMSLEEDRIRLEEEKNKVDAENKLTEMSLEEDRIRLDEARDEQTAKDNRIRNVLDGMKIAAAIGVSAISGAVGIWKFKQSTKKEEDGAYLTTTDKETVREGLRDQSQKGLFKLW